MSAYDIIPTINEFCVDQSNNVKQELCVEHYNNINSRRMMVYKRDVIFDPNIIIDLILENKAQNFGFQIHASNNERAYPVVGTIISNSLADRAGLKPGWKILSVNRTCLYKISTRDLKILMINNKKLGYMKMKLFSDDTEYSELKEPIHLKAPPLKKSTTGSLIKSSFKKLKSSFKHVHKKESIRLDSIKEDSIEPDIDPDVDLLLRMCDSVNELKQYHHETSNDVIFYLTPILSQLNEALTHSIDPVVIYERNSIDFSNDILLDSDISNTFNFYDKMLKTAFTTEPNTQILDEPSYLSRNDTFTNETCVTVSTGNTDEIGVTIIKENQSIIISRILKGSLAEKMGKLKVGDEIIEINKIPIKGLSIEDVMNVLKQEKEHGLTFLIKSKTRLEKNMSFCVDTGASIKNESKYVKALFNYSVEKDEQARCKQLGIDFAVGDILEIVDRTDLFYWQAKKVVKNNANYTTNYNSKIGLIPSRNYYQNVLKNILNDSTSSRGANETNSVNCFSCFQSGDKFPATDIVEDNICIENYECGYQDIILISPDPFNCRPVFLISPNSEILDLLVNMIIEKIPLICQRPTLYTTKPSNYNKKYPYELVTKYSFERAVNHHQFIGMSHSTNQHHQQGYSIKDIWNISQQGKICLIPTDDCDIGRLYKSGLRPYLILLKINDNSNNQRHFKIAKKVPPNNNSIFNKLEPFMDDVAVYEEDNCQTALLLEKIITNTLNNPLWVPVISEIYQR